MSFDTDQTGPWVGAGAELDNRSCTQSHLQMSRTSGMDLFLGYNLWVCSLLSQLQGFLPPAVNSSACIWWPHQTRICHCYHTQDWHWIDCSFSLQFTYFTVLTYNQAQSHSVSFLVPLINNSTTPNWKQHIYFSFKNLQISAYWL